MVRLKRDGDGYIDRDTGRTLAPAEWIPLVEKQIKSGYIGYLRSPAALKSEKNIMQTVDTSARNIAKKAGRPSPTKEDYDKAKDNIAEWLTARKMNPGDPPPFPSP